MMLHANFHVSKLFYGIDIARPGANGIVPIISHLIKIIYYHLPILFILLFLYFKKNWFLLAMFIISLPYTISHFFHLWGEFKKPEQDLSQIALLTLVLVISLLLNKSSWDYYYKREK
jgi:hypothetical protein